MAAISGEPLKTAYLDTVERNSNSHQPWICHIKVNDIPTAFKIDTGAEVSATVIWKIFVQIYFAVKYNFRGVSIPTKIF